MNIYVLSARNYFAAPVCSSIVYDFENIFMQTCDAQILVPEPRGITRWLHGQTFSSRLKHYGKKALQQSQGIYSSLSPHLDKTGPNILLIIAINGSDLEILEAMQNWRQRFDKVIAFVYDAWIIEYFPKYIRQFDHLFVIVPEIVDLLQETFGIEVSYLPPGEDVSKYGSGGNERLIDVISFGRTPKDYNVKLFEKLNYPHSQRLYYRQAPEHGVKYFDEPYSSNRFDYQHRVLLNKMLNRSKISLAFDFSYTTRTQPSDTYLKEHPSYRYRRSVLTPRWFECLAAGCVVVGKRPQTSKIDEVLYWPDATIELPDNPDEGVDFILDLLEQKERLKAISRQNYLESLRHHDYRWRIQTILEKLKLPIPEKLQVSLKQLEETYNREIKL